MNASLQVHKRIVMTITGQKTTTFSYVLGPLMMDASLYCSTSSNATECAGSINNYQGRKMKVRQLYCIAVPSSIDNLILTPCRLRHNM